MRHGMEFLRLGAKVDFSIGLPKGFFPVGPTVVKSVPTLKLRERLFY